MKTLNADEKIIKEINAGKYKEYYIIYDRKSTDDTDSQKNSLDYQLVQNTIFAQRENLAIAPITLTRLFTNGVVTEKHSSFKEDDIMVFNNDGTVTLRIERPKFYRVVEFLNKKLFKGVIFLSLDRASRNATDTNLLKKLSKNGVDIRFTLAKYEKNSAGAIHMDIDGMFSEHHSRVTSEKVTETLNKNRASGKCSYQAPVGYINEGNVDWKPFDPVRAPFVRRFFELADEGWSLADIAFWANKEGFTMPARRPKRTRAEVEMDESEDIKDIRDKVPHKVLYTTIQPILRNRFYIGYFQGENKEWILSTSHEPLVGTELFERVQIKLTKKNKSKQYDKPLDYPFRKAFTCLVCERSYNPYPKKGILYCALKCKMGCNNTYTSFNIKKFVDAHMKPLIEQLVFTQEELEGYETRLGGDIGRLEEKRLKEIESGSRRRKKLREELAYLRENKISLLNVGTFTPEGMRDEERRLEGEIDALMIDEQASEEAMRETLKDVYVISELLKNVAVYWDFADLYEKDEIARIIFSELFVFDNMLTYKLTLGFKPFESRFVFSSARERT